MMKPSCHECAHSRVCQYLKALREFLSNTALGNHNYALFEQYAALCINWQQQETPS